VHHALQAGAVEGDERGRPLAGAPVEQVPHAAQVPRTFFAHGGGEPHGPAERNSRRHQCARHADQGGQAARIVGDARALQPAAAPLHAHVHVRTEHRVEMGVQHDRGTVPALAGPAVDVAGAVQIDVAQPRLAKQLGQARGPPALGAGRRRDGGQLRLDGERSFIRALEVAARGAHAVVREEARNGIFHVLHKIRVGSGEWYVTLRHDLRVAPKATTPTPHAFRAA